jgi:molybdopterin molybdotransferase
MSKPLISIAEARELVARTTPRLETEQVPIEAALNRVLAEDIRAAGDTPPFPCSAMDGYAIIHGAAGRTLTITGESRAGTPAAAQVRDGEAIRISTGAAVPPGADAVIRQEDTEADGVTVQIDAETTPGENVRRPGEDMRAGTLILQSGTRLGAAEIAAAVAAGAGALTVAKRPRVQVLTTGDELREPGEPLGPGEIHNSNGPMLTALADRAGARTATPRRLPDNRSTTERELQSALSEADVVIVSGGVSVGPHDHVKPALAALGVEEIFWGVALQPGKPTWFGRHPGGALVFGLPGNPVSAYVTFTLFAQLSLDTLQGSQPPPESRGTAALGEPVKRNPQREQAIRVRLEQRDGALLAIPNGGQASHIVTSLVGADALALIPPGDGRLEAGTQVSLRPLPN